MDIVNIIIYILAIHFIADFLFQNSWMATNKSKSSLPLLVHIIVYTLILLVASLFIFEDKLIAWYFAIFNGLMHYAVDYVTSKASSYMYRNNHMGTNRIPNISFWSVIGFDQLLHSVILIYSLSWFLTQ